VLKKLIKMGCVFSSEILVYATFYGYFKKKESDQVFKGPITTDICLKGA
jgi:hypothetical protein